jgi:hypothetical protein
VLEYRQREPDGYLYSRWCELYCAWVSRLSPTSARLIPPAIPPRPRLAVGNVRDGGRAANVSRAANGGSGATPAERGLAGQRRRGADTGRSRGHVGIAGFDPKRAITPSSQRTAGRVGDQFVATSLSSSVCVVILVNGLPGRHPVREPTRCAADDCAGRWPLPLAERSLPTAIAGHLPRAAAEPASGCAPEGRASRAKRLRQWRLESKGHRFLIVCRM